MITKIKSAIILLALTSSTTFAAEQRQMQNDNSASTEQLEELRSIISTLDSYYDRLDHRIEEIEKGLKALIDSHNNTGSDVRNLYSCMRKHSAANIFVSGILTIVILVVIAAATTDILKAIRTKSAQQLATEQFGIFTSLVGLFASIL